MGQADSSHKGGMNCGLCVHGNLGLGIKDLCRVGKEEMHEIQVSVS